MKITSILALAASATIALALATANNDTSASAAGKVHGRIVFDGKVEAPKPLKIKADQAKGCCADGVAVDAVNRSLLIGADKGIANVVITLSVAGVKLEVPKEPIVLDQKKCHFEPHVSIIPVGATLRFANSDAVSHNVHTYSIKNDPLNKTVAAKGKIDMKVTKAESITIGCDIHPWMKSYAFVTDDTHWSLSDTGGRFSIDGVPPGEYKLSIWHETLGRAKATVTVKADFSSEAVEVKMGKKKKRRRR
jgi:plastocyanin